VSPRFAADGKELVCLSIPRKGSHRDVFNFAVVSLDEKPRTRILFDHHDPKSDRPPHAPPAFPLLEDCWEKDGQLVYTSEAGTRTGWWRLDVATGKGKGLTDPPPQIDRRGQLAPVANLFLRDRAQATSQVMTWKSDDGQEIEGILTVPPTEVAKPPYKLLVYPHGGPHSRSVLGFDFTPQIFAAHGYAVFQPNFRGSSGYGQKFIDADRFDLGGGDMRDILSGIDELVKRKIVDRERQCGSERSHRPQHDVGPERSAELDAVGVRRPALGSPRQDAAAQPAHSRRQDQDADHDPARS
jgi:hypothetical protein